jgi:hypothetical protein
MSEFAKGTLWISDCDELEKYTIRILELQTQCDNLAIEIAHVREMHGNALIQRDKLAEALQKIADCKYCRGSHGATEARMALRSCGCMKGGENG